MSYNFFIVGGDLRMYYLALALIADGNKVKMIGFDKFDQNLMLNNNIKIVHSMNEASKNDIIIASIPFSLDGENVYTPFSSNNIKIEELKDREIISGKIPEGIRGIDIMKDETYTVLNAIPTVEGAIAKAITETNITLHNNNVLVMGFGRIGKLLCNRLKGMGSYVYCEARKENDLTWIESLGYKGIDLSDLNRELCKIKVIFNTIPHIVLDKERLVLLKPETVIIDVAPRRS